jgi:hypothetical protein
MMKWVFGYKKRFPVISGTTEHIRRPQNISGTTRRADRSDKTDRTSKRHDEMGILGMKQRFPVISDSTEHIGQPQHISGNTRRTYRADRTSKNMMKWVFGYKKKVSGHFWHHRTYLATPEEQTEQIKQTEHPKT